METLLDKLRRDTTILHQELHKHPLLISCQNGTLKKKEYSQVLRAFYQPYKLLIPVIDEILIDTLIPKLKNRIQAIHSDLEDLEIDHEVAALESPKSALSKDATLGVCYVVIGSSMGAAMLSAKISEAISNVPVTYLSMTPKEAGWPELVSALRSYDAENYPLAADAACHSFKLISDALSIVKSL